jgi:hypothetical protein
MLAVARIGALNGGVLLHRFAFATLLDGLTRITQWSSKVLLFPIVLRIRWFRTTSSSFSSWVSSLAAASLFNRRFQC